MCCSQELYEEGPCHRRIAIAQWQTVEVGSSFGLAASPRGAAAYSGAAPADSAASDSSRYHDRSSAMRPHAVLLVLPAGPWTQEPMAGVSSMPAHHEGSKTCSASSWAHTGMLPELHGNIGVSCMEQGDG